MLLIRHLSSTCHPLPQANFFWSCDIIRPHCVYDVVREQQQNQIHSNEKLPVDSGVMESEIGCRRFVTVGFWNFHAGPDIEARFKIHLPTSALSV